MFVTKDVNIPDEIFEALEQGTLVIFAGAGVSVAPPSNLPSFFDLALQIGEGCAPMKKREAIDLYLGRLQNDGVMVHDLAQAIIGDASSKPTKLHTGLINLFKESKHLRIVTTNFDPHFSTVIDDRFHGLVETYYAPALPLGEQFSGLVYLHGSVHKDAKSMVLTDSDFGHAYLTSGWATRFLQGMFAAYTVLFIGYSLSDPIMAYLSRGLALHHVSKPKRFAFTTVGQEERWKSFEITPITYPKRLGRLPHSALPEAITRWVTLTDMGALDHDERIKKIVSFPPPLEKDVIDYLETVLKSPVWIRSFVRHADSLEWFLWASEKPCFKSLFIFSSTDECSRVISRWIAEKFVMVYSDEVMSIVQKNYRVLNPVLWNDLAWAFSFRDAPRPEVLSKWIEVLLSTFTHGCAKDYLEYLLIKCKNSIDAYAPLQLFDFLTRPFLDLEPNFAAALYPEEHYDKVNAKIGMIGDHYHLNEAWNEGIKKNISFFTDRLELILTSRITEGYSMLREFGEVSQYFDPLSHRRTAIEPHEQDRYPEEFDVVIDAARDILEWLMLNEPNRGHRLLDRWLMSNIPLLVRLSIHGMGLATDVSPDHKLQWIVDNKFLYAPGLKHESYQLLKFSFPKSSQESRRKFLEDIERQSVADFIEISKETADYERYNALVWLKQIAPDCPLVDKYLKEAQEANSVFIPREHPDLDSYSTSGFVGHTSPMSVKELLASRPCEIADFLLTFKGEIFHGSPSRSGLLASVSDAVSKKFLWARKLVAVLQNRKAWASDLWDALIRGLDKAELNSRQWKLVLFAVNGHGDPVAIANSVADLLLSAVRKEKNGLIEDSIAPTDATAELIFDAIIANPNEEAETEVNDWVGAAINQPGGKITEYWLYSLSSVVKKDKDLDTLPQHYRDLFSKVISNDHLQAKLGRVLLAGHILFLYSIDKEWTVQNVVSQLKWTNEDEAKLAWAGYLNLGRWNEALLEQMLPMFESTLPRLENHIPHLADRFAEFIAAVAMYSSLDPTEFLLQYNRKISSAGRVVLFDHIRRCLKEMEPKAKEDVWSRWLQRYLTNRTRGVPVAMTEEEAAATFRLLPHLEPVFESAVSIILRLPASSIDRNHIYWELAEQKLAQEYPREVTKVLLHLLKNEEHPLYDLEKIVEMVIVLETKGISQSSLLSICDHLARLSYEGAAELKQKILTNRRSRERTKETRENS
jgi:hypothetical protein